jgi:parallel beta-helix repeat protein
LLAIATIGATPVSAANVLNVPFSYPTIQAAIDASANGDTVLVAPGTYFENISFNGKLITVQSAQGPSVTIIDGGGVAPVANFSNAETPAAVLQGFTLQHGNAPFAYAYEGAGVHISGASPTIVDNLITANSACGSGTGISVAFASPVIRDNTITGNFKQAGCSGDGGGGIYVRGAASAQIIHNTITNNTSDFGGGIDLFASGTPTLMDNTISNNTAGIQGGGVYMVNQSDATIVQNLVTGNTSAQSGGGFYISIPSGDRGPLLVNNTVAGNSGSDSSVFLGGFDAQVQLANDIVAASSAQPAVLCDTTYSSASPMFDHTDLFNSAGPATQGSCTLAVGSNGNISADPQFAAAGDYHLQSTSPAIDAGNNGAPSLPSTDLDGQPRINGSAVDLGVYEVQRPLALAMVSAVAGVEGAAFSAALAHFSGGYGPFSASVDWGDGQVTAGAVAGSTVSGAHAYAEEGSYTVTVTITDSTNATAAGTTAVSVADVALTLTGASVTAVEGATFNGLVASFTDADPNEVASDYSATINWGDQTSSAGTITTNGSGGFVVSGNHAYAEEGTYTVTIIVSDAGGATASAATSASVADAAIGLTGAAKFTEHHKTNFTATVATLTDADPGGTAADYTGQISWGDGTTSACPGSTCTIVARSGGGFTVSGSHNYLRNGTYTVTIRLTDSGGSTASTTTTIVVS